MSNKWMARLGFSTNSHKEYFDGPDSLDDPTHTIANPRIDGGTVLTATAGSGKSGIYLVLPHTSSSPTACIRDLGPELRGELALSAGLCRALLPHQRRHDRPLSNNKSVLAV